MRFILKICTLENSTILFLGEQTSKKTDPMCNLAANLTMVSRFLFAQGAPMAELPTELDILKERLAAYQTCEMSILKSHQSYTMGDGVTYSRADLRIVQKKIEDLQYQIAQSGKPPFVQTAVRYV